MAPRKNPPKYRRQKRRSGDDSAFAEIAGQRVYLGSYGSPESHERYGRLIAEWRANGGLAPVQADDLTVLELTARFWSYAETYYRKPNGDSTSELEMFRQVMRPLVRLYGRSPAKDFDPLRLQAVRQEMIGMGWCRSYINRQIIRVRRIWKWGASQKLVPPSVYHGLQSVPGLKRGQSEARV